MNRAARVIVFALLAFALGGFALLYSEYWLLPLSAGGILVGWGLFGPHQPNILPAETDSQGGTGMLIPTKWNEGEISLGLERYKSNPGMLSTFVNGVISRFVAGQDKHTIEVRTSFLESFNQYAEVARESYKWHRYMKGGRAKLEEDAEDVKAEAALKQAQAELELVVLDTEVKRHEKLLQIEKLRREMADLSKPVPIIPASNRPSASEVRTQKRRDLKERENRVIEEMRITRANPTLSEDQKQRKLNALEDTLGQVHEEQASLL